MTIQNNNIPPDNTPPPHKPNPKSKAKPPLTLKRPLFLKFHTIIASFFLPIVAIFLISGTLLVFNIHSRPNAQTYNITFPYKIENTDSAKLAIIEQQLDQRNIPHHAGTTFTRRGHLTYRDMDTRASLRLNPGRTSATLTIAKSDFISKLHHFHFAVTPLLKIIAIATVIASAIIFLTGVVLALQVKSLRRTAIIWTFLGIAFTILLLFLA